MDAKFYSARATLMIRSATFSRIPLPCITRWIQAATRALAPSEGRSAKFRMCMAWHPRRNACALKAAARRGLTPWP